MGICVGHGHRAMQRLKLAALVLAIALGLWAKGSAAGDPARFAAGMANPVAESLQQRL